MKIQLWKICRDASYLFLHESVHTHLVRTYKAWHTMGVVEFWQVCFVGSSRTTSSIPSYLSFFPPFRTASTDHMPITSPTVSPPITPTDYPKCSRPIYRPVPDPSHDRPFNQMVSHLPVCHSPHSVSSNQREHFLIPALGKIPEKNTKATRGSGLIGKVWSGREQVGTGTGIVCVFCSRPPFPDPYETSISVSTVYRPNLWRLVAVPTVSRPAVRCIPDLSRPAVRPDAPAPSRRSHTFAPSSPLTYVPIPFTMGCNFSPFLKTSDVHFVLWQS